MSGKVPNLRVNRSYSIPRVGKLCVSLHSGNMDATPTCEYSVPARAYLSIQYRSIKHLAKIENRNLPFRPAVLSTCLVGHCCTAYIPIGRETALCNRVTVDNVKYAWCGTKQTLFLRVAPKLGPCSCRRIWVRAGRENQKCIGASAFFGLVS